MPTIRINQAGLPEGEDNRSREDIVAGTQVDIDNLAPGSVNEIQLLWKPYQDDTSLFEAKPGGGWKITPKAGTWGRFAFRVIVDGDPIEHTFDVLSPTLGLTVFAANERANPEASLEQQTSTEIEQSWTNHAFGPFTSGSAFGWWESQDRLVRKLESLFDLSTGHTHDGSGENGPQVNYSNLAGLPGSFPPSAHASSHQDGGSDELEVTGLSGLLADPQTPSTHAGTHQNGGSDQISVAGLSGLLADPQNPTAHASSHQNGGADELSVAGLAGVLADAQVPQAHALDPAGGFHTGSLPEGSVTFNGSGHAHSGAADGAQVDYGNLLNTPPAFTPDTSQPHTWTRKQTFQPSVSEPGVHAIGFEPSSGDTDGGWGLIVEAGAGYGSGTGGIGAAIDGGDGGDTGPGATAILADGGSGGNTSGAGGIGLLSEGGDARGGNSAGGVGAQISGGAGEGTGVGGDGVVAQAGTSGSSGDAFGLVGLAAGSSLPAWARLAGSSSGLFAVGPVAIQAYSNSGAGTAACGLFFGNGSTGLKILADTTFGGTPVGGVAVEAFGGAHAAGSGGDAIQGTGGASTGSDGDGGAGVQGTGALGNGTGVPGPGVRGIAASDTGGFGVLGKAPSSTINPLFYLIGASVGVMGAGAFGCGGFTDVVGGSSIFGIFEGGGGGATFAPSSTGGGPNDGGEGLTAYGGDNDGGDGGNAAAFYGGDAISGDYEGGRGLFAEGGDGHGYQNGGWGASIAGGKGGNDGGYGGQGALIRGGEAGDNSYGGGGLEVFGGNYGGGAGLRGGWGIRCQTGQCNPSASELPNALVVVPSTTGFPAEQGRGAYIVAANGLLGSQNGGEGLYVQAGDAFPTSTVGGGGAGAVIHAGDGALGTGGGAGGGGHGLDAYAGQGNGPNGEGGVGVRGYGGLSTGSAAPGRGGYFSGGANTAGSVDGGDGVEGRGGQGYGARSGGRGAFFKAGVSGPTGNGGWGLFAEAAAGGSTSGDGGRGVWGQGGAGSVAGNGDGGLGTGGEGGAAGGTGDGGWGGLFIGGQSSNTFGSNAGGALQAFGGAAQSGSSGNGGVGASIVGGQANNTGAGGWGINVSGGTGGIHGSSVAGIAVHATGGDSQNTQNNSGGAGGGFYGGWPNGWGVSGEGKGERAGVIGTGGELAGDGFFGAAGDSARNIGRDVSDEIKGTAPNMSIRLLNNFHAMVAMVGWKIRINGATTAGNDGIFTITGVTDQYEVTYSNASGFAEAIPGGATTHVLKTSGGRGGAFTGGDGLFDNAFGGDGVQGFGGDGEGSGRGGYGGYFVGGNGGASAANAGPGVRGDGGNAGSGSGNDGGMGVHGVGGQGDGSGYGGQGVKGESGNNGGYGGEFQGDAAGGSGTRASLKVGAQSSLPDGELGAIAVVGSTFYFHDGTSWRSVNVT